MSVTFVVVSVVLLCFRPIFPFSSFQPFLFIGGFDSSALCRSRRELSNEYLLAKFGFDTAENETCKFCPLSAYRSPRSEVCSCLFTFMMNSRTVVKNPCARGCTLRPQFWRYERKLLAVDHVVDVQDLHVPAPVGISCSRCRHSCAPVPSPPPTPLCRWSFLGEIRMRHVVELAIESIILNFPVFVYNTTARAQQVLR